VSHETISLEMSPRRVATITLNRPEKGNAFNQMMLNELGRQLSDLAEDPNVRVVVLRGSGKHFCAGADIGGRAEAGELPGRQFTLHDILAAIDAQPKPTVAVIHGAAVGGGAAFAACCDVVVASDTAFFSIPEVRIGMAPVRLAPIFIRAMGYRGFRRYGMSGERFSAGDALRLGLVHEVCPTGDLEKVTAEIVDAFLHGAPGALGELKRASAAIAAPLLPGGSLGAEAAQHDVRSSPEAIEGIASFREKRKPRWYPTVE